MLSDDQLWCQMAACLGDFLSVTRVFRLNLPFPRICVSNIAVFHLLIMERFVCSELST